MVKLRDLFKERDNMNKNLEEFIETLLEMRTKEKMHDFLQGILTPKELLEIDRKSVV